MSNDDFRLLDLETRAVSTLGGSYIEGGYVDGVGTVTRFYHPEGVAIDPTGSYVLVVSGALGKDSSSRTAKRPLQADTLNQGIRRIDLATRRATSIAGDRHRARYSGHDDGVSSDARFYNPCGIAIDGAGTFAVIVSDAVMRGTRAPASVLYA